MALQSTPELGGPLTGGAPFQAGGFNPSQWFSQPPFGQFGQLPPQQQFFPQSGPPFQFGQPAFLFGQSPIEQPKGEKPNFIQDWIHGIFGHHNQGSPLPFGQPQPAPFLPFLQQVPGPAIDTGLLPENLKDKKD